jgi:ABC-type nitrate/sulfonate/bicarbonate transport system permease component
MQLFMIVSPVCWPVLFSTKVGVESVDRAFSKQGGCLVLADGSGILDHCAGRVAIHRDGIRTASAIALVLTITVEMLTGRPGIGFYIENVRISGLVTDMWAAILVTGVLGYLVNATFMALERCCYPGVPENRDR